ncbi:hypothetical protein BJX64DRAFT_274240 [Aspergillus heterothallicus]
MVNRGRSGGCVTCKQRRVKCNEARPQCGPCRRLGLQCGGYKTKYASLKFKDETHKFGTKANQRDATGHGLREEKTPRSALALHRPLAEPDTAVPFFLQLYVCAGRDLAAARGFFEVLIPIYNTQPCSSPLSLAMAALAEEVQSIWRHDNRSVRSFESRATYHTQAMQSLRSTLQNRDEWGKPATMLAVIALQLYENVAAIYGLRSATRTHQNGAVSLLPFAASDPSTDANDTAVSAYIRGFVLHTEISAAMRQERPLVENASSWFARDNLVGAAPENPSTALDIIGASVAQLQARYIESSSVQMPAEWIAEAKHLDEQLVAWVQRVPSHLQPRKLISGRNLDALSIHTYQSVCEIYSSCQIGAIWNLWRIQRLLLARIIFTSLERIQDNLTDLAHRTTDNQEPSLEYDNPLLHHQIDTIQSLVDSICHSVPFYLGNRTRPSSISDFADPTILLPSCHPQVQVRTSSPTSTNENDESDWTYHPPGDEQHKSHIIAQGPWHIMSPLSRLLTLFSTEPDQERGLALPVSIFRRGQYEWICEQFLRVTLLLHIRPGKNSHTPSREGGGWSSKGNRVEDFALAVRKGAVFMSGP